MPTYAVPTNDGGKQCKSGSTEDGIAGEIIAAGDPIYKNTDNKWYIAKASMDLVGKTVGVAITKAAAIDNSFQLTTEQGAVIAMGVTFEKDKHVFPNASGVFANVATTAGDLSATNRIHYWGFGDGTDFVFWPQITDTVVT